MRVSFKERPSNKENKDYQHYSFSKNGKTNGEKAKRGNTFVQRVNGYIEMLSPHEQPTRPGSRDNRSVAVSNKTKKYKKSEKQIQRVDKILQKLKVERSTNRNLQKCVIEIQKMLWQRNDRLQQLEQQLRDRERFVGRKTYVEQQQGISGSCSRVKESQKELKRKMNTLGMRQLLSSMDEEEYTGGESVQEMSSQSASIEDDRSYIKIRRPRTESQSQAALSKRKK